jgi:hypothetical protein
MKRAEEVRHNGYGFAAGCEAVALPRRRLALHIGLRPGSTSA